MTWTRGKLIALLALGMGQSGAADLNPQTSKAWDEYVGSVRAQLDARLRPTACFLWADEDAERLRRLRGGEILVTPADEETPRRISGGLIHHWLGAVFIPGVTVADVIATIRDYDRYNEFYPSIVNSKLTARTGPTDRSTTVERHQAMFSTIALDADVSAFYARVGDQRGYSVSQTTRLQEIQNYGGSHQYEMEPNAPKAYLWKLATISRYQERDGGVYLELEGLALSRDIPSSLRWLVDPFVRKASASAMAASLRLTRQAVLNDKAKSPGKPAAGAVSVRGQ